MLGSWVRAPVGSLLGTSLNKKDLFHFFILTSCFLIDKNYYRIYPLCSMLSTVKFQKLGEHRTHYCSSFSILPFSYRLSMFATFFKTKATKSLGTSVIGLLYHYQFLVH